MRLFFIPIFVLLNLTALADNSAKLRFIEANIGSNSKVEITLAPVNSLRNPSDQVLELTKAISEEDYQGALKFYNIAGEITQEEKLKIADKFLLGRYDELPTGFKFKLEDFLNLNKRDLKVIQDLKKTQKYAKRIANYKKNGASSLVRLRFLVSGVTTFVGIFVAATADINFQQLHSLLDLFSNPASLKSVVQLSSNPEVIKSALVKAGIYGMLAGTLGALSTKYWDKISKYYLAGDTFEKKVGGLLNKLTFQKASQMKGTLDKFFKSIGKTLGHSEVLNVLSRPLATLIPSSSTVKFSGFEAIVGSIYMISARTLGISGGPIEEALVKELRNTALTIYTQGDLNITSANQVVERTEHINRLKLKIEKSDLPNEYKRSLIDQLDDLAIYYENKNIMTALWGSGIFAIGNVVYRFGLESAYFVSHAIMKAYAFSLNPKVRLKGVKTFTKSFAQFFTDLGLAGYDDVRKIVAPKSSKYAKMSCDNLLSNFAALL